MTLSSTDFVIREGLEPFKVSGPCGENADDFVGIEVDSRRDYQIRLVYRHNGVTVEEVRTGIFCLSTGVIPQSITRRWYKRMERWRKELLP